MNWQKIILNRYNLFHYIDYRELYIKYAHYPIIYLAYIDKQLLAHNSTRDNQRILHSPFYKGEISRNSITLDSDSLHLMSH